MKQLTEFTKEDLTTINELLSMKRMTSGDVVRLQNFMVVWIDNKINICQHCAAQIRHAHSILDGWYNINIENINKILNPINSCLTCGAELKDNRRKYCNDECKNAKLLLD